MERRCWSEGPAAVGIGRKSARIAAAPNPIRHVVVIVRENHSFDNLFGRFPHANGATTAHEGSKVVNLTVTPDRLRYDLGHGSTTAVRAIDAGKMDRFNYLTNAIQCVQKTCKPCKPNKVCKGYQDVAESQYTQGLDSELLGIDASWSPPAPGEVDARTACPRGKARSRSPRGRAGACARRRVPALRLFSRGPAIVPSHSEANVSTPGRRLQLGRCSPARPR